MHHLSKNTDKALNHSSKDDWLTKLALRSFGTAMDDLDALRTYSMVQLIIGGVVAVVVVVVGTGVVGVQPGIAVQKGSFGVLLILGSLGSRSALAFLELATVAVG
jgi:hypothetical protein